MTERPIIVFILADDLGWRDLGCYGSSFYETPVADRLAREGMLFTDAYASCPVCSPTRASLTTGLSPARVGMTQAIGGDMSGRLRDVPYFSYLPYSDTTIAEVLRPAGYRCWPRREMAPGRPASAARPARLRRQPGRPRLAARERQRVAGLSEGLRAWQDEVEALVPKANPNWQGPTG